MGLSIVPKAISDGGSGSIPVGLICMWSGATTNIPESWALCDGSNGTPDLRDRFIVGAGSTYSVGNTGGSDSVTLTTSELPSHSHSLSNCSTGEKSITSFTSNIYLKPSSTSWYFANYFDGYYSANTAGNVTIVSNVSAAGKYNFINVSGLTHSHTLSGSTATSGSGSSHENRPPYYALAFIMYLG